MGYVVRDTSKGLGPFPTRRGALAADSSIIISTFILSVIDGLLKSNTNSNFFTVSIEEVFEGNL